MQSRWAYGHISETIFWIFSGQKVKSRGKIKRGEQEDQKMRCNSHFFSHFSIQLEKTDINWEKLVKEAKNAQKTSIIPENTLSPKNWLKTLVFPNF